MARPVQVGVLLLAVLALAELVPRVLGAELGHAEHSVQQEETRGMAQDAAEGSHVRDKRRLPDPGFIIPATPMGFTKKEPQEDSRSDKPSEPREIRMAPVRPGAGGVLAASPEASSEASPRSGRISDRIPDSLAVSSLSRPKKTKLSGREDHMQTLSSFLDQTRKLGVPDGQALELLDKELSKATRQRQAGGQGDGQVGGQGSSQRPVYHATPLKPYGALINFNNQAPYEKHQLRMKPIKWISAQEQLNDIPPPKKPLVVESDKQHLAGKQTEAVVVPSRPLPVSVPVQLDPVHLLQTSQAQSSPQLHAPSQHTVATVSQSSHFSPLQHLAPHPAPHPAPLPAPHHAQHLAYQSLSVPSYQQLEQVPRALQSIEHNQLLHSASVQQEPHAVHAVRLQALQGYPEEQQQSLVSIESAPLQPAPEVHQPIYVYQHEEKQPPTAQVHVELPTHTKQVEIHEDDHQEGHQEGLYHDQQQEEYASQYRFGYRVRDDHAGNDFGHVETKEGKMTKGEYFVSLPDGRLQSVRYWADPTGYHAHVTYTSHATHPGSAPEGH